MNGSASKHQKTDMAPINRTPNASHGHAVTLSDKASCRDAPTPVRLIRTNDLFRLGASFSPSDTEFAIKACRQTTRSDPPVVHSVILGQSRSRCQTAIRLADRIGYR